MNKKNTDEKQRLDFYTQRTVEFDESRDTVRLIDQTVLPETLKFVDCETVEEVIRAIKTMQIRGAPAIGVAGAMAVALSFKANMDARSRQSLLANLRKDARRIREARPTAVNLAWGVDKALDRAEQVLDATTDRRGAYRDLVSFVNCLADRDVRANKDLSDRGAALIQDNASVLTHCKCELA